MTQALDFFYWPTPNGWKVSILLEELGLPYRLKLLDIGAGEQFSPEFYAISPNQRMPAIIDHDVEGPAITVFESGAILLYLADKTGRFIPPGPIGRKQTVEWLFWQASNLGPMAGQHSHFWNYAGAQERNGYAAERYRREYMRCIHVLERWLKGKDFILGEYSIGDMMSWPWILIAKKMGVDLKAFPNVASWRQRVKDRPAVQRGVALAKGVERQGPVDEKVRETLFNQTGLR